MSKSWEKQEFYILCSAREAYMDVSDITTLENGECTIDIQKASPKLLDFIDVYGEDELTFSLSRPEGDYIEFK